MNIHIYVLGALVVLCLLSLVSSGIDIWKVSGDCKKRQQRRKRIKEAADGRP